MTMKTRLSLLLTAAAATVALAIAPSASAQVAFSGTVHGPHGAVRFRTGVPYYGSCSPTYSRDGYCDYDGAYAPSYYAPSYTYYDAPIYYVRPVPRRYVYRNYARPYVRSWSQGRYGGGYGGHPYGGLRDGRRGGYSHRR